MFRTHTDHTVTVRRPNPDSGDPEFVDVVVKKGTHAKGSKPGPKGADFDAALEQLWFAGLADDDDRPAIDEVTDIVTGEPVLTDTTVDTTPEA